MGRSGSSPGRGGTWHGRSTPPGWRSAHPAKACDSTGHRRVPGRDGAWPLCRPILLQSTAEIVTKNGTCEVKSRQERPTNCGFDATRTSLVARSLPPGDASKVPVQQLHDRPDGECRAGEPQRPVGDCDDWAVLLGLSGIQSFEHSHLLVCHVQESPRCLFGDPGNAGGGSFIPPHC